MEIACNYAFYIFIDKKVYSCEFLNQNISANIHILPSGAHQFYQQGIELTNEDVIGVIFNKCNLTKVPQGLTKIFPNMKILSIWSSTLNTVTKKDLAEYKNIERIGFCDNLIEYLPGDLFEGFSNLEEVSFNGNKLKLIEPKILSGLDKLKTVSFADNPAYTKCFSILQGVSSTAALEEVKDELFVRFYKDHKKIEDLLKVEAENRDLKKKNLILKKDKAKVDGNYHSLMSRNANLEAQIFELRKIIQKNQSLINLQDDLNKEIKNLKAQHTKSDKENLQNQQKYLDLAQKYSILEQEIKAKILREQQNKQKFCTDMIKLSQAKDGSFKDFKIQIDGYEFKVHKYLLAARSPTLAEILKNNPEVENLNLVDISVEIFEIILKFLYTDELPGDNGTNFLQLFAAAGKLKIEELKDYSAIKLLDRIGMENVIDILKISNKYEHNELRLCAFGKIKEEYPKIEFRDEWSKDVEAVIKIIDAFKMKEEAIKIAEEEFKNLIIKS